MNLAPIVLFVYNRPEHTRKTLESLAHNDLAEQSELFIYSDGPKSDASNEEFKKIQEVRELIREKQWCKNVNIYESETNKGLANSIISGVTNIVNQFGNIIVMEDDLILAKGFLKYMNDALNLYEHDSKVMHISGYMFPVKVKLPETFFYNSTSCWGWGTWVKAWESLNTNEDYLLSKINHPSVIYKFDISGVCGFYSQLKENSEGKIKTWAIKWYASVFLQNGLSLHPRISLVRNIGHDLSGSHCRVDKINMKQKIAKKINVNPIPIEESLDARNAVIHFYRSLDKSSIFDKIIYKLKKKHTGMDL